MSKSLDVENARVASYTLLVTATALLLVLSIFAPPARADARDQLCNAVGSSSGCIGSARTTPYTPPREPTCDYACRQQAAEDERYALEHIVEPGEVPRFDSVAHRAEATYRSAVAADDGGDKVLLACVLVVGAPAEAPLWLAGLFGAAVIVSMPGAHLERYVPAIWESLPISLSWSRGSYVPAPRVPKAFPDLRVARRKTPVQGGGGLRKRWVDEDGNIYEWDYRHGRVEKYNKLGKHVGEYDPDTGEQTKPADPDKKVDP